MNPARRHVIAGAVAAAAGLAVTATGRTALADRADAAVKQVTLAGSVNRAGVFQLSGKGPWTLKEFLQQSAGGFDGDEKSMIVRVYSRDENGKDDLVAQVPLELVLEDPDLVLYVKPAQRIHVIPNKRTRLDKKGL